MNKDTFTIIAECFIITNTICQCIWFYYTLRKDRKNKKTFIK